jgi:hypothetical protein
MQYAVSIAGQSVSVSQLNIVLTIDKTLDYGSFVLRNTTAQAYDVGTEVDIDITDGTDTKSLHFIINADDVQKIKGGYYVHSIDIIELTKILEWNTESVRTFTQPTDPSIERLTLFDVVSALQLTLPLERVGSLNNTRVFSIDSAISSKLQAIEAPEFVFNNKNLKEILMEIFDYITGIPRLIKVGFGTVLTADFYNEKGNLVTEDDFSRMERFNIDGFSTALDTDIKNLYDRFTTVVEPSPNNFKKLGSDEGDLTSDNAVIKTEYPIVELESVKIKADVYPTGQNIANNPNLVRLQGFEIDITSQVLEKEEWDDLSNKGITDLNYETGDYRDNTLFFDRFKNNISGLFDEVGTLSGASIIRGRDRILAVVQRAVVKNGNTYDVSGTPTPLRVQALGSDFYEIEVQITYKAQFDSRTEVKRYDTSRIKFKSSAYTGQSDNVVRADRALDRLVKLQQLLGNAEVMTAERVTAVGDLYELSDFTSDNNILTTIELQCEKEYIIAKYLWTSNYQKVSEFIGLDSGIRSSLFAVPNDTYRRNIYLEDFIEVDTQSSSIFSNIQQEGLNTFLNTFSNSPSGAANKPINVMVFDNESVPGVDFDNFAIIKPVAKYGGGNSINFHVDFQSPTIAGTRVNKVRDDIDISAPDTTNTAEETPQISLWETIWNVTISAFTQTRLGLGGTGVRVSDTNLFSSFGKPVSKAVLYTDNLGRIRDAKFAFLHTATIQNPQIYPLVERSNLPTPAISTTNYWIQKDTREELAITYAIQVLPKPELQETIIIGRYVTEQNNLIKSIVTDSGQFEVFGTNIPYTLSENRFSRSTDTVVAQTYSINTTTRRLLLSGTVAFSTWGIRRVDTKELVFAVNQGSTPITSLYFNPKDRQTGVIYPSQTVTAPIPSARPVNIQLIPPSNNPTDTTIDIVWQDGNTSPASDEFEIGISSNLRDWVTTTQAPAVTNAKSFTGLTPFTEFTIRIRARRGSFYSEFAYFNATTTAPAPPAPTNLQLTLLGDRRILATWDEAGDDVFLYRIEASESSGFSPLISGGIKTTFFNDTKVIFDFLNADIDYETQYFFRVRALRDGQFSAYSATANITTSESPLTSAPLLTNVSVSGSNVTFTLVNTDDQLVTFFADFATATTSRATGVRPNESRTFTLAFGGAQNSIFARAKAALKDNSAIVAEQFIAAEAPGTANIGATGIVVNPGFNVINYTYTSPPLVSGFVVERDPDAFNATGFGEVSAVLSPDTRRFIDLRVLSGQSYTYRVRAYNQFGSTLSNTRTVTSVSTVPNAPSGLAASAVLAGAAGEGFFTLTWQRNSTDEDGFLVERKLSTQGAGSFAVVGGTSRGQVTIDQTIVGDPDTTYDYRIIAFNEFGNSTPSNTVSVFIA